jgi:serine kinase of HPr protein (carbohydrate metabolism regulator)
MIRHAGLLALRHAGCWRGALIEGPSGCGKSDLAVRALDAGFRLVTDDRTLVFVSAGRLYGRAPAPLAGLMELRGLGVLPHSALPFAPIDLVVRCVASPAQIERMAPGETECLLEVTVDHLDLFALEHSAPAKLRRALEHLGRERATAYQASLAQGRPCADT